MVQRYAYPVQEVASALDASRALQVLLHTHTHTLSGQEVRSEQEVRDRQPRAPSFLPTASLHLLVERVPTMGTASRSVGAGYLFGF